MAIIDIMIEQMATARNIVEDGNEVVPAWRISTPEGTFLVLTRYDHDQPEQRERVLQLISNFMRWKMATSFVVTGEVWLSSAVARTGEEALLAVGVSHHERVGLIQRIREREPLNLGPPEWLAEEQIDEPYFKLLPSGVSEITAREAEELAFLFGKDGEFSAERLSG